MQATSSCCSSRPVITISSYHFKPSQKDLYVDRVSMYFSSIKRLAYPILCSQSNPKRTESNHGLSYHFSIHDKDISYVSTLQVNYNYDTPWQIVAAFLQDADAVRFLCEQNKEAQQRNNEHGVKIHKYPEIEERSLQARTNNRTPEEIKKRGSKWAFQSGDDCSEGFGPPKILRK